MRIAPRVEAYLADRGVDYELVPHPPAGTSSETAGAAGVPGADLAKAVVIDDHQQHYALVVVPAIEQINLGELRHVLGETVALATDELIERVFADCDSDSVPPFGEPYGLAVLVDERLLGQRRVYAESGARGTLLALDAEDFAALMGEARQGRFGHPA